MKHLTSYILYLISTIAIAVAVAGCYADEGNYTYHELDAVGIDTTGTGLQAQYAIMRFDELDLNPNIVFNGQTVNDDSNTPLDYLWTIYSAVSGTGASTLIDTLGYERHLKTKISRSSGNYYVQLTVTNRNDSIRQFWRVPVSVSEVFDGGWMVFYERADATGYSDIALVVNPWTKLNSLENNCYTDLYLSTNGEMLKGKPLRCLDIAVSLGSGNNYIGLCTDYTVVGVSENGIEKALDFNDFFHQPPTTMAPTWYGEHGSGVMSGQSSEILINNNRVYTNTYTYSATEGRTTRFSVPKTDNGIGTLAAWNSEVPNTLNYGVIVYDQTNTCFRFAAYNGSSLERFGEQDLEVAKFDVNNTGMTLLMGDWGKGLTQGVGLRPFDYLLMAKGTERYLLVTNFATTQPNSNNIGVGCYPMDGLCPDIISATTFAASHVGNFVYYGAGNKVYNFAYDSTLPATVAWTAQSSDEEVTCVRIMKYYHGAVYGYGMVPSSDNLIHIATWNATTQQGHLYQYLINPASGILDETSSYDYPIPGRVKDMAWKFFM